MNFDLKSEEKLKKKDRNRFQIDTMSIIVNDVDRVRNELLKIAPWLDKVFV